MFVREVMTRAPRTVGPDVTAVEAAAVMRDELLDCLVVVDGDVAVGLLTAADLVIRVMAEDHDGSLLRVLDVCDHLVFTAAPDQEISEVQRFMLSLAINHVVVLDQGEPVGLVSLEQLSTSLTGLAL